MKKNMIDRIILTLLILLIIMMAYKYIDFINKNQGAFTVLLTLALVITTIFYAIQTKRTVDTMKREGDLARRPYVEINAPTALFYGERGGLIRNGEKVKSFQLKTVIKNSGIAPAQLISLKIIIPQLTLDNTDTYEVSIFQNSPLDLVLNPYINIDKTLIDTISRFGGRIDIKITIKYRVHDADKDFEAHNESMCSLQSPPGGEIFEFKCELIKSYTN